MREPLTVKTLPAKPHTAVWACPAHGKQMQTITQVGQRIQCGWLVSALIALGVGFGLPVTPGQVGLIMAAVGAILAVVTRSQVAPAQDVQTALDAPAGTTQRQLERIIEKQN